MLLRQKTTNLMQICDFAKNIAQFQGFIDVRARGARQKFYEKFLQK